MFKKSARILAAMAFVGLAGCVSNTEIPFDHASNPGIKKIGILTVDVPNQASVILASDIGQSFGLIGALVDASMEASRESKFNALLHDKDVVAGSLMLGDLKTSLAEHGYTAVDIAADRSKPGLLKTYPAAGANAVDAYLDVSVFGYGYVAAGIAKSNPYRPYVNLKVRLVREHDGAVLMEDTVLYNPVVRTGAIVDKAVTISPDPSYAFSDFDALTGAPDKAASGLSGALDSSSHSIGTLVQ